MKKPVWVRYEGTSQYWLTVKGRSVIYSACIKEKDGLWYVMTPPHPRPFKSREAAEHRALVKLKSQVEHDWVAAGREFNRIRSLLNRADRAAKPRYFFDLKL